MSNRRSNRKRRQFYRQENARYPGRNFHHLLPRSRGGEQTADNLLLIHIDRHRRWHNLFGTRSLEEVILLLVRVHRAKGRCLYAKMGLPCRLAPCLDVRPAHSRKGHSAKKETVVQMLTGRNGAGAVNIVHRVIQHHHQEQSGNRGQRTGKGKQVARLKAVPDREMKKALREGRQ